MLPECGKANEQMILADFRRARKYWKRELNNMSRWLKVLVYSLNVIAQGCGQTLGLGLVDKNRTVSNY